MRMALLLVAGLVVGCGGRTPLKPSDGGQSDASTSLKDGGADALTPDGSSDGSAHDSHIGDGSSHDGSSRDGHAADDRLVPSDCERAGGVCIPRTVSACRGVIATLSCGSNQLQCCIQDDGGTPENPCAAAGGTCVGVYPGSCPNGLVVSLSCNTGVGVECCMSPPDPGSCAPSGGCPKGPLCGSVCCNTGEQCDGTTGTCLCGSSPPCTGGDLCGAALYSPDACGTICCGQSTSCPR